MHCRARTFRGVVVHRVTLTAGLHDVTDTNTFKKTAPEWTF